jgi:hypothetical protein
MAGRLRKLETSRAATLGALDVDPDHARRCLVECWGRLRYLGGTWKSKPGLGLYIDATSWNGDPQTFPTDAAPSAATACAYHLARALSMGELVHLGWAPSYCRAHHVPPGGTAHDRSILRQALRSPNQCVRVLAGLTAAFSQMIPPHF